MSRIPNEPKKIRAAISRYERNFKKRDYRDGSGSRFLLGPFYMMVGDVDGALAHYKWFDKKFPESSDEPFHVLYRCLAYHRAGEEEKAELAARRTYLANPYMIPYLLDLPHSQPAGIRRSSNWEEEAFVTAAPTELFSPWTQKDRAWLATFWNSERMKELVQRHIEIEAAFNSEHSGPRRTALVRELSNLQSRHLKLVQD
jgi:hypothetical protein